MLHRVTLVRTDVSVERIAFIIRVTRIGELRTTLAVTSNRNFASFFACYLLLKFLHISPILVTLMMESISSSETSVLTRATLRNIPEDGIVFSHIPENLKSYLFSPNVYKHGSNRSRNFCVVLTHISGHVAHKIFIVNSIIWLVNIWCPSVLGVILRKSQKGSFKIIYLEKIVS
jgi:hypothetical protein